MKKISCTLVSRVPVSRVPGVFFVVGLLVLAVAPQSGLRAQPPAQIGAAVPAQSLSVAGRTRDLNKIFDDIWQDKLKHDPEYATYLGDKRYDAELTDYSPRAVNDTLARGRGYIERLSNIDTSGLPRQEQLSADLMLRSLIEDQEGAPFKEW
jgi:uncharacterized protein (DUF885 family)